MSADVKGKSLLKHYTFIRVPYSSLLVSCMIVVPITFSNSLASACATVLVALLSDASSLRLPNAPCRTAANLDRL